jgi:hypothetical protein
MMNLLGTLDANYKEGGAKEELVRFWTQGRLPIGHNHQQYNVDHGE